jgi:hypothetical protein
MVWRFEMQNKRGLGEGPSFDFEEDGITVY